MAFWLYVADLIKEDKRAERKEGRRAQEKNFVLAFLL